MLERYCRTQLSYDKDKLMTILSLAKRMETILDDIYVSALWVNIVPSQLLWRVENFTPTNLFFVDPKSKMPSAPQSSRPAVWAAPTWPWVSINGPLAVPRPITGTSLKEFSAMSFVERGAQECPGLLKKCEPANLWHPLRQVGVPTKQRPLETFNMPEGSQNRLHWPRRLRRMVSPGLQRLRAQGKVQEKAQERSLKKARLS